MRVYVADEKEKENEKTRKGGFGEMPAFTTRRHSRLRRLRQKGGEVPLVEVRAILPLLQMKSQCFLPSTPERYAALDGEKKVEKGNGDRRRRNGEKKKMDDGRRNW